MSEVKKETVEPWLVNLKAFALESGLYNKHPDGTIECLKSVKLEKSYVDSFNGALGNLPEEFGGKAGPKVVVPKDETQSSGRLRMGMEDDGKPASTLERRFQ